jgi:hypothetical protein
MVPTDNKLVYSVIVVLVLGTYLKNYHDKTTGKTVVANIEQYLLIAVLGVVLLFTVEELPDVGKPLCWLILVAYLGKNMKGIQAYIDTLIKNNKNRA